MGSSSSSKVSTQSTNLDAAASLLQLQAKQALSRGASKNVMTTAVSDRRIKLQIDLNHEIRNNGDARSTDEQKSKQLRLQASQQGIAIRKAVRGTATYSQHVWASANLPAIDETPTAWKLKRRAHVTESAAHDDAVDVSGTTRVDDVEGIDQNWQFFSSQVLTPLLQRLLTPDKQLDLPQAIAAVRPDFVAACEQLRASRGAGAEVVGDDIRQHVHPVVIPKVVNHVLCSLPLAAAVGRWPHLACSLVPNLLCNCVD